MTVKGAEARAPWTNKIWRAFEDYPIAGPLLTWVILFVLFVLFVPNFATTRTMSGMINAISISGVVTLGVTMLMISGEFDLSVGAMLAMAGYMYGMISTGEDVLIANKLRWLIGPDGSQFWAIVFALAVPALMGLGNGLLRVVTEIPSFIVTLGTRQIYRGLVWVASGGILYQTRAELGVYELFNGRWEGLNLFLTETLTFERANFRTATIWVVLALVVLQILLQRTLFGNWVYAIGGNIGASIAQGVRANRTKLWLFVNSGLMSGIAGIIGFSQFRTVRVAEQVGIELTAIAAAVVGGTLLTGGYGSVLGGFLGILTISTLNRGVILVQPSLKAGIESILLATPEGLLPVVDPLLFFVGGFFKPDNFTAVIGLAIIGSAVLNNYLRGRSMK